MKRIFTYIISLALILFIFVGCVNKFTSNKDDNQSSSNLDTSINSQLEENIKTYIRNNSSSENIKMFKIVSTSEVEHGMIISTIFEINNIKYEGFFQIQQENSTENAKIINGDFTKIDSSAAFTVHQMSGVASIKGEQKKTYIIVGGVINNKKIKSINITFNDGLLANIIVGSNNTYSYVRADKLVSIKLITALDKDGNTIFTYPPYPPVNN